MFDIEYLINRQGSNFRLLKKYGYGRPGNVTAKQSLNEEVGGFWKIRSTKGFYFENGRLQYNFLTKGTQSFTLTNGVNSITTSSTITNKGPVLIFSETLANNGSGEIPYIQHNNSFYPAIEVVWAAVPMTSLYKATVPANSYLVNVRDGDTLFYSVNTQAEVLETNQCYFDVATREVFVKPIAPPAVLVYLDVVYDLPKLKIRELTYNDIGNKVVPTYKMIDTVLIKHADLEETQFVATTFSGDFITHSLEVDLGGWIVLEYYVQQSFIITSPTTLQVYTSNVGNDKIIVSYEAGIGATSTDSLEVNPEKSNSYITGYVTHSETSTTASWIVSAVELFTDKESYCSTWGEEIIVNALLLNSENIPCPNKAVTINVTNGSVIGATPTFSNNKGEVFFKVDPTTTSPVTISVTSNAINKTKVIPTALASVYLSSAIAEAGVNLLGQKDKTLIPISLTLDGIPDASGTATTKSLKNCTFSSGIYKSEKAMTSSFVRSVENMFNYNELQIETENNTFLYASGGERMLDTIEFINE